MCSAYRAWAWRTSERGVMKLNPCLRRGLVFIRQCVPTRLSAYDSIRVQRLMSRTRIWGANARAVLCWRVEAPGNCVFVQSNGFGFLIDAGIGPRLVALTRLAAVGATWRNVNAVILTHTHTDHWKDLTFAELAREKIPLYCCPLHHAGMTRPDGSFAQLLSGNLVKPFGARCSARVISRRDRSTNRGAAR